MIRPSLRGLGQRSLRHSLAEERHGEPSVRIPLQYVLLMRVRPVPAVEIRQRHATPVQSIAAVLIPINLDVHHNGVRLLNLPDPPQLHLITEASGKISAERVAAQVARRRARQKKKYPCCAH